MAYFIPGEPKKDGVWYIRKYNDGDVLEMLKWDEKGDVHGYVEVMEDDENDGVNTNLHNIDMRGIEASDNSGSSIDVEYDVENDMDAIDDDSDEATFEDYIIDDSEFYKVMKGKKNLENVGMEENLENATLPENDNENEVHDDRQPLGINLPDEIDSNDISHTPPKSDDEFVGNMKGGALLVAIGKDGNNQRFPVAWVVVEVEKEDSWLWFLQILFEELNIIDGYEWAFISNQQKGLMNAINRLAPDAKHRNCVRHI
ncbi:hypothetical protein GH714_015876 [Hevea brasiliensis]|uniref:MULE transposase domain-containing protein n=1 Tax=Hevea brasiliensis TaxID=3981 RepID=A0A6A6KQS1_HEVBR|nr:hypothetical protein GH714_015876 [Hevea brasiliensis]